MDLSLYDVKALSKAHVNNGVILRYMQNQGTIYVLNASDVKNLADAGVNKSVIDYMLQTPTIYGPGAYPPVTIGVGYWGGPYWGPGYPGPYCYPYRRGYCH